MRTTLTQLTVATFLSVIPLRALASGFASPQVGPTNSGVSSVDAVGAHKNPGALGLLDGLQLIGGGDLVIGKISYQRERRATYQHADSLDFALPIDPSLIDPTKSGNDRTVSATPVAAVPAIFGALRVAKLPLTLGMGLYVPYAAQVNFSPTGPQRFQIIDATLGAVFLTPAIAYRVHPRVSIGAGISYVLGLAEISKIQDVATLPDLGRALARPPISQANDFGANAPPAVRELDTMARPFAFKNGRASGATFNLGLAAKPTDDLTIGASYEHTTPLTFRGDFTLDMDDPFFTADLSSQGLEYPAMVRGKASLSFTLPRVARLGVRYAFGDRIDGERRIGVAVEGTYTGWSSIDTFDLRANSQGLAQPKLGLPASTGFKLRRDWHDTYGGLVRGTFLVSSDLSLWGMLGAETAASPDSTIDAASPDGTRLSLAGGLSQHILGGLRVILDAQLQSVFERRVVSSDYDIGNGTYSMRVFALGAYGDYRF